MKIKQSLFYLFFLICIDQLSKYLIRSRGGFYICNSGVAFGIKINPFLLWIAAIFLILFIIYYAAKIKKQDTITKKIKNLKFEANMGVILILSGAIANLIDRWQFGCVVDFIDLKFWPVFNLADTFITIGAVLLLAEFLKKWYNNPERKK
jgi:signal peptidase II